MPTGPERCFNATDDNCNGILDEGCGVETGLVQVAAAWDEPEVDVDLNVIDPNGELAEVGRTTRAGLVKQRDCPGKDLVCAGFNMENVFLEEGEPLEGKYRVQVRLEKLGGETPPIVVRVGARVGQRTYAFEFALSRPEEEQSVVLEL